MTEMLLPWSVAQVKSSIWQHAEHKWSVGVQKEETFLLIVSSHLPGHTQGGVCVSRCVFCTAGIELCHSLPDLSEDMYLFSYQKIIHEYY